MAVVGEPNYPHHFREELRCGHLQAASEGALVVAQNEVDEAPYL